MTEEAKQYITPKEGGWVADFVGFFVEPNKKGGTSAYLSFSTDCGEGKVYYREYLRPSEAYGWKYPLMMLNKVGKCIGSKDLSEMEAKKLDDIYNHGEFQFCFSGRKVFICFQNREVNDKRFLQISSVAPYGLFPELKSKGEALQQATAEYSKPQTNTLNPLPPALGDDEEVPF